MFGRQPHRLRPRRVRPGARQPGRGAVRRHLVDLGSGNGRALILAARYPFRSIVGVEFAFELHAAAENMAALPTADRSRIRRVHEDAARFAFPNGPLVVFLYNPFEAAVCRAMAQRPRADLRVRPRPVRGVYLNPRHRDAWTDSGWNPVTVGAGFVVLAPREGSG